MNIRWDESPVRDDLTEPVDITIMTASQSAVVKVMLPGWVMRLPIKLSVAMFSVASLLISIVLIASSVFRWLLLTLTVSYITK